MLFLNHGVICARSTDNMLTLNLDKLRVIGIVSNIVSNVARQIKRVLDLRINLTYLSVNIYIHSCTIHFCVIRRPLLIVSRSRAEIYISRARKLNCANLRAHLSLSRMCLNHAVETHYCSKNGERFIPNLMQIEWNMELVSSEWPSMIT